MFCGFDLFCLCFLFSWLCLRFHSSSTPNWVSYNWLDVVPQNQKRSNPNSISCSASRFCVSFITFISLFILFVNLCYISESVGLLCVCVKFSCSSCASMNFLQVPRSPQRPKACMLGLLVIHCQSKKPFTTF